MAGAAASPKAAALTRFATSQVDKLLKLKAEFTAAGGVLPEPVKPVGCPTL